jgi:hypothetical protein
MMRETEAKSEIPVNSFVTEGMEGHVLRSWSPKGVPK